MPIPGDAVKNMLTRGGNLWKRFVKDMYYGRTAVAGRYKLPQSDINKIINAPIADGAKVENEVLGKNKLFANQNSLEAFKLSQGTAIKEGDVLSVSGFNAVKSRYYRHPFSNTAFNPKDANGDNIWTGVQADDVIKDIRDMGAVAAAGVVGFKAVQTGVSLLVGDDF